MKGLVHIYTGNGKGKTTAAIGLGIRACGRGLKVLMVQFLKSAETGEMFIIKRLEPDFTLFRGKESRKFTWNMDEKELEEAKKEQKEIFDFAVNSACSGRLDLLIMDEVLTAVNMEMISLEDVVNFLNSRPEKPEVVLTGRNAPEELVRLADYVSEIRAVKHPMDKGVKARKGIEF